MRGGGEREREKGEEWGGGGLGVSVRCEGDRE